MILKHYRCTKDQIYKYFYAMEFHQQMQVNYTFGSEAKDAGITVLDYIFYLIDVGRFTYQGKPVKIKE